MIVLETIAQRWYAFGFIAAFFWAATAERNWRGALRFLATAAAVSWIAEYMSTHSPFPYGRYDYVARTRGEELYLSNVPAFVPLSFGVVVWAGRSLAQAGLRIRTPGALIAGGALLATVIDLAMDPITMRGHDWFLGRLYSFEASGPWFGVPLSNFGGWLLVSATILWIDELFEHGNARVADPVRGPTLAAGILAFFALVALGTRHWTIALAVIVIGGVLYLVTRDGIAGLVAQAGAEEDPQPSAG